MTIPHYCQYQESRCFHPTCNCGPRVAIPATVYRGFARNTPVAVWITQGEAELGVGTVPCIECEGTGDWDRFQSEPTGKKDDCVECKGTGRLWVST